MNPIQLSNDVSIVISSEAGQGLQSMEQMLSKLARSSGYNVFTYSEFMSRIRGGNNSTEIRISLKKTASYVDRIDIFIPMCRGAMSRFKERITKETFIIGDNSHIDKTYKDGYRVIDIPLLEIMKKLGGNTYINTLILGYILNLLGNSFDSAIKMIEKKFKNSREEIINNNREAVKKGFELSRETIEAGLISIKIEKNEDVKNDLILYGNEAIGLGAIAGGCNFISSYPMSPSTGVLTFLAENSEKSGIIVEQAEDEISAINMGLGAWYAGGRAMVTTSGGGFALMAETLSLTGAIESPMVIHIGQRPGPATGMPTRTEQGDFFTALYSGHGEFPRIIFAPGDMEDGIRLTHHAFNVADKFQTPVIILTDQYFMDSSNNMNDFGITELKAEKYFEKTDEKYARYKFMENGISPRGIPDYGQGIVRVDSDEHDENGYLTEDFNVRTGMVNKRIKKMESIIQEIIPPARSGSSLYKYAIVCWGSVRHMVEEAIAAIPGDDIACFSFTQVYPLYRGTADLLKAAEKLIIIENNATSQFGSFIKQETGIEFDYKILKYNGMPFSVEEITDEIKKILLKE